MLAKFSEALLRQLKRGGATRLRKARPIRRFTGSRMRVGCNYGTRGRRITWFWVGSMPNEEVCGHWKAKDLGAPREPGETLGNNSK